MPLNVETVMYAKRAHKVHTKPFVILLVESELITLKRTVYGFKCSFFDK